MNRARGRRQLTEVVRTPDGRRLTVERWGDPDGSPVFLLHALDVLPDVLHWLVCDDVLV
jgi:hypothetical protein